LAVKVAPIRLIINNENAHVRSWQFDLLISLFGGIFYIYFSVFCLFFFIFAQLTVSSEKRR